MKTINHIEVNKLAITVNIYYSGMNGNAKKFVEETVQVELLEIFVQKMETLVMNIFSQWTREPKSYDIKHDKIEIVTKPYTNLWQRTYYHFRNDNAPVLQMKTSEKYFSFIVKTEFESKHRFDQCGIV